MWLRLIMIPLISAAIGYITNVVAVKMLFRPRYPKRFLFWTIQGVLPKRQADLAKGVGEVVEREFISMSDLLDKANTPELQETLVTTVVSAVKQRIDDVMPKFIPPGVTGKLGDLVEGVLRREAQAIIRAAIENGRQRILEDVKIGKIIEDKINEYEVADAEGLVMEVAARELRFIEVMGGVLGIFIGLVQDLIMVFL